ncbi:MAG: hypothetical protein ACPGUH_09460, partial [Winogradskyella sp.]
SYNFISAIAIHHYISFMLFINIGNSILFYYLIKSVRNQSKIPKKLRRVALWDEKMNKPLN